MVDGAPVVGQRLVESKCHECQCTLGRLLNRPVSCGGCSEAFCASCIAKHALVPADIADVSPDSVVGVCTACYWRLCNVSRDEHVQVIESKSAAPRTIVLGHGGLACRAMYRQLGRELASHGFRVVLFDLPGHGSREKETLTTETMQRCLLQVIRTHAQGQPVVYVGNSLSAYGAVATLAKHPELFAGAVLGDMGQDVGVTRGIKARFGLHLLGFLSDSISARTMCQLMMKAMADPQRFDQEMMREAWYSSGVFLTAAASANRLLTAYDYAALLPHVKVPVLFVNGEKDHRDSEQRWVQLTPDATLLVYPDVDHFYSHDRRSAARYQHDILMFARRVTEHWPDDYAAEPRE